MTQVKKIPLESTIDRWSRIVAAVGRSDRYRADVAVTALYRRIEANPPSVIWADTPADYAGYVAQAGDSIIPRVHDFPLSAVMDMLTLEASPRTLNHVAQASARLTSAINSISVPGVFGQGSALQLAGIEHALPGIRYREWVANFYFALADLSAECYAWYPAADTVIILPHPDEAHLDPSGRLHSLTSPALRWGTDSRGSPGFTINQFFRVHGVNVPSLFVLNRASLSVRTALNEPNLEVKRAYFILYGAERLLKDANATAIAKDDWGTLWRLPVPGDEDLLMVEVLNSTPEPDGTFKTYYLRVHPECRPMLPGGQFGNRQPLTPLNAIASTFGFTGADYAQKLEFQS